MDCEIITGVQRPAGILVLWKFEQEVRNTFFSYPDLARQKINGLDLLEQPKDVPDGPGVSQGHQNEMINRRFRDYPHLVLEFLWAG